MTALFIALAAIWVASFLLVTWGVGTLKHLRRVPLYDGPPIRVSIIVAARNEAHTIETALQSVLSLDYPDYEVVVINDRSTDDTGVILQRMAHPRLRIVDIDQLPPNWLGKNHALHVGAQRASGEYLLFTDADVVMQPTTLSRAVSFCEDHALDHIAVFPDLPAPNYFTGACFAVFGMGFLMLTQPWFVRNGKTPLPVGIGAFNLVRRVKYDEIAGHTRIPMRPDDDVSLAYQLRRAGARQDILIGHEQILVEWYRGLGEMIRGLEKNAFAPFEYSALRLGVAMSMHIVCYIVPWAGLFYAGPVRWAALVAIVAQMLTLLATSPISFPTWRYLPAMPMAALVFEYTVIRAATLTFVHRGIRWRDTFYSLSQLRSNKLRA